MIDPMISSTGNDLEPPLKKVKTEKKLIPASEFISQATEKIVRLTVQIPKENSRWNLNGQTEWFEMNLTDTVLQLKEKLEGLLGGMKPNKQKLVTPNGIVLKDQMTFADHNLAGPVAIQLKVKER